MTYKIPNRYKSRPRLTKDSFKDLKKGDVIHIKGIELAICDDEGLLKHEAIINDEFIFEDIRSSYVCLMSCEECSDEFFFSFNEKHSEENYEESFLYGTFKKVGRNIETIDGYDISIVNGQLKAGCQLLTKKRTLKLWKSIGDLLGYEIEG